MVWGMQWADGKDALWRKSDLRYAFQIKPKTWKYLGSTRVPLDGSEVPTLNLNPALLIEFSIFKSMA